MNVTNKTTNLSLWHTAGAKALHPYGALPTHRSRASFTGHLCFVLLAVAVHLTLPSLVALLRLCQWSYYWTGLGAHVFRPQFFCQLQDKGSSCYVHRQALLVENVGVYCSHVQEIVKHCYWPSSCCPFHRIKPCHLIQHVNPEL